VYDDGEAEILAGAETEQVPPAISGWQSDSGEPEADRGSPDQGSAQGPAGPTLSDKPALSEDNLSNLGAEQEYAEEEEAWEAAVVARRDNEQAVGQAAALSATRRSSALMEDSFVYSPQLEQPDAKLEGEKGPLDARDAWEDEVKKEGTKQPAGEAASSEEQEGQPAGEEEGEEGWSQDGARGSSLPQHGEATSEPESEGGVEAEAETPENLGQTHARPPLSPESSEHADSGSQDEFVTINDVETIPGARAAPARSSRTTPTRRITPPKDPTKATNIVGASRVAQARNSQLLSLMTPEMMDDGQSSEASFDPRDLIVILPKGTNKRPPSTRPETAIV